MGYVERNLLPNEHVLYKTRLHWVLLFLRPALWVLAGLVLAAALWRVDEPPWLWYAGAAVATLGLARAAVRFIELRTSEFAVTTTRVIFKIGLIARYTTELLLTKVETVGVSQSLLGRLLNFGDLTVIGTGGTKEVFRGVRDPIGFRNHVQQASTGGRPSPVDPAR